MSQTTTYTVTGMTCTHCVQAVTSEITELPGVSSVRVDPSIKGTFAETSEAVGWKGWRGTALPSTAGENPMVI